MSAEVVGVQRAEGNGKEVERNASVQESSKQRVDIELAPSDAGSILQPTVAPALSSETRSDPNHALPDNIHSPSFHSKAATDDSAAKGIEPLPPIIPPSLPPPLPAASSRNSTQLLLSRSISKANHLAINVDGGSTSGSGLESSSTGSGIVIGRDRPKEVIRIERDWSSGEEIVQFWSGWVWELEGRLSPKLFQDAMDSLNSILASAHDPYKHIGYTAMSILTLYINTLFVESHYQKEMAKFDEKLNRVNREVFNPVGLNFLNPSRSAYLFLELECY